MPKPYLVRAEDQQILGTHVGGSPFRIGDREIAQLFGRKQLTYDVRRVQVRLPCCVWHPNIVSERTRRAALVFNGWSWRLRLSPSGSDLLPAPHCMMIYMILPSSNSAPLYIVLLSMPTRNSWAHAV